MHIHIHIYHVHILYICTYIIIYVHELHMIYIIEKVTAGSKISEMKNENLFIMVLQNIQETYIH